MRGPRAIGGLVVFLVLGAVVTMVLRYRSSHETIEAGPALETGARLEIEPVASRRARIDVDPARRLSATDLARFEPLLRAVLDWPHDRHVRDDFAVGRREGLFQAENTPPRRLMEALLKGCEDESLDFEYAESEPVDRLTSKLKAGQGIDPVIDGNAAIAEFVTRVRLDPHPTGLRIVNGPSGFKSHPLLRVTIHEVADDRHLDQRLRFDRATNGIEVSGEAFHGFSLWLNDGLLDLDRPRGPGQRAGPRVAAGRAERQGHARLHGLSSQRLPQGGHRGADGRDSRLNHRIMRRVDRSRAGKEARSM